jgi:hypothetical protein
MLHAFPIQSIPLYTLLLALFLSQPGWASERPRGEGRQLPNSPRAEQWPYAPWRNAEPRSRSDSQTRRQPSQPERVRDARRESLQPVSDNKNERPSLTPEARRELRQQIHEAGKELYR